MDATAQVEGWTTIETAKRIRDKVRQRPGISVADVRRSLSQKWRDHFDDGLEHAKLEGWVFERPEPGQGSNKRVLHPGDPQ